MTDIFNFQRIQDQLIFSTVRIERVSDKNVGTGFFFNYEIPNQRHIPLLITNKHVKESCEEFLIEFHKAKLDQNRFSIPQIDNRIKTKITIPEDTWFDHPNPLVDVTILPIANLLTSFTNENNSIFYIGLSQKLLPSRSRYSLIKPIEQVVFIGYPAGMIDKKNWLPIVRQGITATPILADYCGFEVFLIDAFIFGGSSGSPVFILDDGSYTNGRGNLTVGLRVFLVGIISHRQVVKEKYEVKELESIMGIEHERLLNLGTVFRFTVIQELIENTVKKLKIRPQ